MFSFTPNWNYKPTNAIHANSSSVYNVKKKYINLSTIDKIHLKYDCIDGTVVDRERQPILYSSIHDKPSSCKIFLSHWNHSLRKKINPFWVLKLFLENDNHKEINFNRKSKSFTLTFVKNWYLSGLLRVVLQTW